MAQTPSTHAAGCSVYPPNGQVIEISDTVELLSLSQQLLALCIRLSEKIDPEADFLVGRAAERVAVANCGGLRRQATSEQRPQANSEAKPRKLGRAKQMA
jgi:hypothetical protein